MRGLQNLLETAERPALIFCPTRRLCEQAAFLLQKRLKEPEIRYYHAGLSPALRSKREKWFFESDRGIMTATCAYGMGMDKGNIRTVIHYSLPASVEAYLQESGRAGRDRQPCRAVLLYHPEDRDREKKNPRQELRNRYEKLVAFAEDNTRCRRESLLAILKAEPEDCDSCDVCRGGVILKDPAEDFLTETVRLYRRRFTSKMLVEFLCGRYSREIQQGWYERSPRFGEMREWDPDDVDEMIRGLTISGRIRIIQRGSWKGKLH
jgi:ATP-dependent DNA helicase RecQ